MKKIAIILLLGIFMVNSIGYRFIMSYFGQKANTNMIAKLDNHQYNEHELIEIKVPLNLPYFINWENFERCDGQVEFNGTTYNYVARKYSNNEMIYRCIPNREHDHINTAKKAIDNLVFSDTKDAKEKKPASPLSNYFKTLSEYDDNIQQYSSNLLHLAVRQQYPVQATALYHTIAEQQTPPPDQPVFRA